MLGAAFAQNCALCIMLCALIKGFLRLTKTVVLIVLVLF